MSVFVIGLLIGAGLGAAAVAFGAPFLDRLDPPAFASAPEPAAAKLIRPSTSQVPAPVQPIRLTAGRPVVIGVFGDSLGDGMWAGLYNQFRGDRTYQVIRFSRAATGFARYDYVDIQQQAIQQLDGRSVDVAVVMAGANDEQGISDGGDAVGFGTARWRAIYVARIDALVGLLRQRGAAVYWVGLPKMRRASYDQKAQLLNAIYEDRARALGAQFVPTTPVTIDARGQYDDYLTVDGSSRPRLMRARDGIHMTMAGYMRISAPVASAIRGDVGRALAAGQLQARAEPGAGSGAPTGGR